MDHNDLIDQAERAKAGMRRRSQVYRDNDIELEPMSHTNLWRHATRLIHLMATMSLTITKPLALGPTVNEWRYRSEKSLLTTRYIIDEFAVRRKPLGQTEFVQIMAGRASESNIKTVLRDGVELKLLQRVDGGYIPTALMIDECFERALHKILQAPVVEFCRFVVNFHDNRENNLRLLELEERQALATDKEFTMQEKLFYE